MSEPERYSPPSDFLVAVVHDDVPLGEDAFGRANLARLIGMTRDADEANRDWATHLLATTSFDDDAIRSALRERLGDEREETRLEALIGLAKRDPASVLRLVGALLEREFISTMVLEAAAFVADPVLVPVLDGIAAGWADDADRDEHMDWLLSEARRACTAGVQPEWRIS